MKKSQKGNFREKICIFLLFLGASFSICYWAITKYDVYTDYRACGDAQSYIKMSKFQYEDVRKPFRYRVLMPSIVSVLNRYLKIDNFLKKYYENVDAKIIQLNFGIVNIFSIAGTAFLLFYYCFALGFSKWESLAGSFLYLTSFFVVTYYSVPMVDSLASFFIMAGFYAVLKNSLRGLFLTFLFGMFTKETTLLVLPLIILEERRFFTKKLLACLPGIILYALFIFVFRFPTGWTLCSALLNPNIFKGCFLEFLNSSSLYFLIEDVQTFMFLWVLFFYGLFRCTIPIFIKRALWLMLLILLMPPLAGTPVVGRVAFYLFPIVIPISLLSLRDILRKSSF